MGRFRMLVTDVDGTLVGRSLRPSPRVRAALRAAANAGWRIALCTGRGPRGCRELLRSLDLDGTHIFFNGALVSDAAVREVIDEHPLPRRLALQVIDAARSAGLTIELSTIDGLYVAQRDRLTSLHSRTLGVEETEADLASLASRGSVVKAELVVESDRERTAARDLAVRFEGSLSFEWAPIAGETEAVCVNVVPIGVSKASGMHSLASVYDVRSDEIIAVGDGPNDVPLIRAAGFGVAMGNASVEVRREAALVTGGVEEDGLAMVVERFLAEER